MAAFLGDPFAQLSLVVRRRLGRHLSRRRFPVGCCCGLLILVAPFLHAYTDSEKWLLMSRHGECTDIAVLERKVDDIDGINDPATFMRVMRQRGYNVTERTMPEVGGDAVQVDVAEKGLSLLFVKASLCREINGSQGNYDAVWTVTMASSKTLQLANPLRGLSAAELGR